MFSYLGYHLDPPIYLYSRPWSLVDGVWGISKGSWGVLAMVASEPRYPCPPAATAPGSSAHSGRGGSGDPPGSMQGRRAEISLLL